MAFKRLEYCGVHVTTGTVSGVPTTTPTNEGSEHLVLDANGKIIEYYVWTKDSTGTSKWVGGAYNLGDRYATTSTTCQNITTASGDITIQVAAGLSYLPLQTIVMIDAANSNNHMHCDIVSYNKTTGVMVVNVKQKSGTGNICNWLINLDSFEVAATSVLVTQNNTSGNIIGSINVNGVTTSLYETAPFKHLKEWHVDKNGSDITGTGAEDKPYQTIAKALTVAGSTGEKIVVHPGTYVENITVSQLNLDIVGESGTLSGVSYIQGTVTVTGTGTSSSVRLGNIMTDSVVHTGTVRLVFEGANIRNSVVKSGTGSLNSYNSFVNGASITGAGQCAFIGGEVAGLTINNAAAVVSSSNVNSLALVTLTAGVLGLNNTTVFAATSGGTAISAAAGTVAIIKNSSIYDSGGVATKVSLLGSYSLENVYLNKAASTLGTNLNQIDWFNNIGIINVPTITGATKMLVRDANGVVSEQNFPTGGGSWTTGTAIPTATGNTTTSLGVTSLPTFYENTTTGVRYYVDSSGVSRVIESSNSVLFGSSAPTSTTAQEGDEFFVTSNGTSSGTITAQYVFDATSSTWVLRPTPVSKLTTTSLAPKTGTGTSYVNPTLTSDTTLVDEIQLSDGSYIRTGKVTWTGHGLPIHTYFYASAVAPYYTSTIPTTGYVQQLFFTQDENTIDVSIQQGENTSVSGGSLQFAKTVYFNATNPTSATIFDIANPPVTNNNTLKADSSNIYIGTDGSTWTYNSTTSTYNTYVYPTTVPHGVFAYQQTGQSIPSAVVQSLLNLNTVSNTVGSAWNAATGEFTVQRAGWYSVGLKVFFQAGNWTNGNQTQSIITKNGSYVSSNYEFAPVNITGWYMNSNETNDRIYLNVGDKVRGQVYQNSGTAKLISGGIYSTFSIVEIK